MTVGIVGAGITGLALHHYLHEADVRSVVFESESEPGGVIKQTTHEGHLLELGPQRTRLAPAVVELIDRFGLGDKLVTDDTAPLYIYHAGKLRRVPKCPREALTTDLVSWRGKLRALLEPFTAPPRPRETVADFLTRSFGSEVADRIAGPLYGSLYGSHPDEMYVEYSLSNALERAGVSRSVLLAAAKALATGYSPPAVVTFTDGMQTLPSTIYEEYADTIHLNAPVTDVTAAERGFDLETPRRTAPVDTVIFSTPAGATAALLDGVDAESARSLGQLNYNPFAVVHLFSDAELEGAGYQVPFTEPYKTLGVTSTARLRDWDGIYTCFLGGGKAPDLVKRSDPFLKALAADEFDAITGHTSRPLHVHRLRPGMPAYDTTWTALDGVEPPDGVWLCANYAARAGIPGRITDARRTATAVAESVAHRSDRTDSAPCRGAADRRESRWDAPRIT